MWKKRTLKLTMNGISYTNIPGCSTCLHLETCFCPPLHYYSYLTGVKSKVDTGWPFSWSGAKKHHITETVYHCFCWVSLDHSFIRLSMNSDPNSFLYVIHWLRSDKPPARKKSEMRRTVTSDRTSRFGVQLDLKNHQDVHKALYPVSLWSWPYIHVTVPDTC